MPRKPVRCLSISRHTLIPETSRSLRLRLLPIQTARLYSVSTATARPISIPYILHTSRLPVVEAKLPIPLRAHRRKARLSLTRSISSRMTPSHRAGLPSQEKAILLARYGHIINMNRRGSARVMRNLNTARAFRKTTGSYLRLSQ